MTSTRTAVEKYQLPESHFDEIVFKVVPRRVYVVIMNVFPNGSFFFMNMTNRAYIGFICFCFIFLEEYCEPLTDR